MTVPAEWEGNPRKDYLEVARDQIQRQVKFHARYAAFTVTARDIHGPLGELLRDIITQYESFRRHELRGHTTVGEGARWDQVIDSAMGALDFLNGVDLSEVVRDA